LKRFVVAKPLLFKLHMTHPNYCRNQEEKPAKFKKKKFLTAQKPEKQFSDVINCHFIIFCFAEKLAFLSKKFIKKRCVLMKNQKNKKKNKIK